MDKKSSQSVPDTSPVPLLQAFGQAVRDLRKERGFSQETFAQYCGLDRSYMGGVERGERNITLTNMERIISALHLKPSEFFLTLDVHFRHITVQRGTFHLSSFAPYFRQPPKQTP